MTKARDIASAIPAPSTVSSAELGYLDGVTSAIQTQVDAKTAKSTLTTTGDIYYASAANTPARLGIGSTGNVLTVASGIPSWAAPAGGGKVLQMVTATSSTATTIASTTLTDTTLTATITPTLATSKILILITQQFRKYRQSGIQGAGISIFRGATSIWNGTDQLSWHNFGGVGDQQFDDIFTVSYVDSPATTSATTYKTQGEVYSSSASGQVVFQDGSRVSTITLLEIGA